MSANSIFKRTGAPKVIAKDAEGFLTVQITLDGQPDWDWMEYFEHPSNFIPNEAYPSRATVFKDTITFKSSDTNVEANIKWMDKYIQQANDLYKNFSRTQAPMEGHLPTNA